MKNYAKMFYSCNQLPEINEDTDAAFRRFIITEWNQQFLGNDDNKNLFNELTTEDELSGILNLLIHKARQILAQQKLSYEQSTEELRMGWKERANPIQRFSKERLCDEKNSIAIKSEVYTAYVDWCKSHQINPKNESQFTKKLKSLGFRDDSQRVRNNVLDPKGKPTRIWISVTLVTSLHSPLLGKQTENTTLSMVDEDTCNSVTGVTKKMFVCESCGAGPFGMDAIGSGGVKIKDFHEKQGHTIKSYSWNDSK